MNCRHSSLRNLLRISCRTVGVKNNSSRFPNTPIPKAFKIKIMICFLAQVVIQEGAEAADPLASKILEVLYATEDGFAVPDDEEAALPNHDF